MLNNKSHKGSVAVEFFTRIGSLVLLALICGCPNTNGANPGSVAKVEAANKIEKEVAQRAAIQDCQTNLEAKWEEARKLFAQKLYWQAAIPLRRCGDLLDDKKIQAFIDDAEFKGYQKDFNDPNSSEELIKNSHLWLREHQPDQTARLEKTLQLNLAAARAVAQKEEAKAQLKTAKAKRQRGVHIGMSASDVLASSWGRPQNVNRTSYSSGTHEQWIYGGSNYLYFENGVLTTIQN